MDELDRLESQRRRALSRRVLATFAAAGIAAVLVGISWSWHPGRHRAPPAPSGPATNSVERPTPAAPAHSARPDAGTVFVQPLADCQRTDHRHTLRVAMAVQNLANQTLQLVSIDVVDRVPGLTLSAQTIGVRPCADQPAATARRLRPSEEAVVALQFTVGPECPAKNAVTARLGFLAGGAMLHAETANVVDLSSLRFDQCG